MSDARSRHTRGRDRRRRALAVLSLVAVGSVLSLIVAATWSRNESPAATGAPTPTTPPAIPCPTKGAKTTAGPQATSTATPAHGATWTGVFERVTAHLGSDGSVKKTPRQFTRASVEGSGPVTVAVPMSDKRLRKRSRGKKPSFVDGKAQIKLDPNGSSAQQVDSDFTEPLPVAVKITYKLDNKPVSERDLRHKSGSVEVDYQLTNTTTAPVTVCFEGFNGQLAKRTVQTPIPIIAHLSLTVPKSATTFHAPGAALSPAKKGVDVAWTVAMFEPLGPTTKAFQLEMTTSKAEVPNSHVLIETLDPLTLTGAVPAKSAAAVGKAAAAAQSAAVKVQSDVAAIELKAGQPKQPHQSRRSSGTSKKQPRKARGHSTSRSAADSSRRLAAAHKGRGGGSQTTKTAKTTKTRKVKKASGLSFGTPMSALTGMRHQVDRAARANRTFLANLDAPTKKLLASTRGSIDGLAAGTSRAIDSSTPAVNRSIDRMNASIGRSLTRLKGSTAKALVTLRRDLRRGAGTPALNALTAGATRLQASSHEISLRVAAVNAAARAAAAGIDQIVSLLPTPVQDALLVDQRLTQIQAELDGLSPAQKADPAIAKLAADVTAAESLAGTVSAALTDIQQRAQAVAGQMATLQTDVVALQTTAAALEAAALANAQASLQGALTAAAAGADARFAKTVTDAADSIAKARSTATRDVSTAEAQAKQSVASANSDAKRSVSSARRDATRHLDASLRSAQLSVLAAQQKITQTLASVQASARRALASAKQKAKQGGQAALASAQAASAQATAAVQHALGVANTDYARLLTTNQRAVANQLPGGDVTGATEQNGSFWYSIAGS